MTGTSTRGPQAIQGRSPHALTNFPSESFGLVFGGVSSLRGLFSERLADSSEQGHVSPPWLHHGSTICLTLRCQIPGASFDKELNPFSSMGWPRLRLEILQGTPGRPLRVKKEKLYLQHGLTVYTLVMNNTTTLPALCKKQNPSSLEVNYFPTRSKEQTHLRS